VKIGAVYERFQAESTAMAESPFQLKLNCGGAFKPRGAHCAHQSLAGAVFGVTFQPSSSTTGFLPPKEAAL
jgi:hypothetical protein